MSKKKGGSPKKFTQAERLRDLRNRSLSGVDMATTPDSFIEMNDYSREALRQEKLRKHLQPIINQFLELIHNKRAEVTVTRFNNSDATQLEVDGIVAIVFPQGDSKNLIRILADHEYFDGFRIRTELEAIQPYQIPDEHKHLLSIKVSESEILED